MSGRLLHYSSKPIVDLRSNEQGGGMGTRWDKPRGLWVSVEGADDWRSWCETERFGNPREQLCYDVRLADEANVLRLTDAAAILKFSSRYCMDPYMGPMAGRTVMSRDGVDWVRVAKQYDGIIIAPYCWSLRLDERTNWYYGWDCASGCIWNAAAIASLSLDACEVPA